jgi:putative membrane protein
VQVDGYASALVSAVLLGFVNAIIRPLLVLITLPITLLTLGLFTLVINALMFWAVSGLVKGFVVPDFSTAFWGALVYSLLTWMVSLALADKD